MFALTVDEAAAIDDYDELRKRILAAYKELEQDCEFVVCGGTDSAGSAPALDSPKRPKNCTTPPSDSA